MFGTFKLFLFFFTELVGKQHIYKTKAAGSDSGSGLERWNNLDEKACLCLGFERNSSSILVKPSQAGCQTSVQRQIVVYSPSGRTLVICIVCRGKGLKIIL